jgi:uncharacterized membrane protein (DUF485 family)
MSQTFENPASPARDQVRLQAEEVEAIRASKNKMSISLTLIVMVAYFGFIFLIAFRKDLVGSKLLPHLTWGIPMGIGVIVLAWLLTGSYVYWANRKYDPKVVSFRKKWEK